MGQEIETPDIYLPIYNTPRPITLITGGRGSAKSFNAALAIKRLSYEEGHKILFTRYTLTSANISIIPEFTEKMDMEGDSANFAITKNEIHNNYSGSDILFKGIKTSSGNQTANLKSIQGLTTFIVDEAEEFESEEDYDKIRLSIRVKGKRNRVIIIMNPPDDSHFIYQKYIKNTHKIEMFDGVPVQISTHPDVEHIHTTYLNNIEHLSDEFINEVASIKEIHDRLTPELKLMSKYAYKVMGRWADRKEGVIFPNWTTGVWDESLSYCYGQDYGFSVDPTTLLREAVDNDKKLIYVEELLYSTDKLGTNDIFQINMSRIKNPNDLIVGDSAEDRLIVDLRSRGMNIIGAKKGPGSIVADITAIQDYTIVVCGNSPNMKHELNNYIWNDKKAGIAVDKENHLCDPMRYAFNKLVRGKVVIV